MPGIKTPQAVKDDFYVKYSNIKNYNELIIKNNNITKELNNVFKNNVWNLNENIKDLNNKNIIAKAITSTHGEILSKIGAFKVVYPEKIAGRQRMKEHQTASGCM